MAKSIFKREKLLADLRAMSEPHIHPIIDMIENKQIGYTNPKPKPSGPDQLVIDFRFDKKRASFQ